MARNRQRAKERQAERRAARQAGGEPVGNNAGAVPDPDPDPPFRSEAPPEELGRSDYTLEHTSEEEEFIGDLQVQEPGEPDEFAPRGVRGDREHEEHDHHERGRVMGFLHAVSLELRRVQWPDRPTLTSLTGITLMFVLIVGGYLGLLDAVFSKLVQAIL